MYTFFTICSKIRPVSATDVVSLGRFSAKESGEEILSGRNPPRRKTTAQDRRLEIRRRQNAGTGVRRISSSTDPAGGPNRNVELIHERLCSLKNTETSSMASCSSHSSRAQRSTWPTRSRHAVSRSARSFWASCSECSMPTACATICPKRGCRASCSVRNNCCARASCSTDSA